ncbi:hypothetical protein LOD99_5654 [Oopsacas minuta]|uniref:Uncharacterized protein n=1 Tax=Oopsacas minuta TaxID=111878 RepID=A0AAV7JQ25_9METZ|nr:hypothetical protein LOD99_5654 [Oopsacas minuta]
MLITILPTLSLFLIICGDVEVNPGPRYIETGDIKRGNEIVSKMTDTLSKLTGNGPLILNNLELLSTQIGEMPLLSGIYPKIEESISKLNSSICLDKEFDFELENITELDESLPNEMEDNKTYKSRSPFSIHYQNELMNCKRLVGIFEMEEQNESTPKNNYYFPDLPSFLVAHSCKFVPSGHVLY